MQGIKQELFTVPTMPVTKAGVAPFSVSKGPMAATVQTQRATMHQGMNMSIGASLGSVESAPVMGSTPMMSARSSTYQTLGSVVTKRAAGPTMMMSGNVGAKASYSGVSNSNVVQMASQSKIRSGQVKMFAGAPSVSGPTFSVSQTAGIPMKRNYFGSAGWASNAAKASRRSDVKMMAYKITLITPEGEQEVECDGETYILDAAEEAGIDIPYSCRAGACSSCAGIVKSGSVDQSDGSFLDDDQMANGFALTCVAYPTSDCTIETHKEDDLF